MSLLTVSTLLAFAPTPQPGQQQPPIWTSLVPLVLLVVVFYFVLIRPQQRKAKEQSDMLKNIRPGDEVITTSGIMGKILSVKENSVTLRSADTKLEVTKASIGQITGRNASGAES